MTNDTKTTDFQRGAEAMRAAIERMLRVESRDMRAIGEASKKVVERSAYEGAATLLWSYANGVMDMPLPEDSNV